MTRKKAPKPKPYHKGRNALDESLAKIGGVLGLITLYAKAEDAEHVLNACWLISDELENLDDAVSDVFLSDV